MIRQRLIQGLFISEVLRLLDCRKKTIDYMLNDPLISEDSSHYDLFGFNNCAIVNSNRYVVITMVYCFKWGIDDYLDLLFCKVYLFKFCLSLLKTKENAS